MKGSVLPWVEVTALKSDVESNSRIMVSRHGAHTHTRTHIDLNYFHPAITVLDPLALATNIIIQ